MKYCTYYYFLALRGFVMENKNAFLALEQNIPHTFR